MSLNPILEEIYAAREQLLAEAGGDLHRYVQEARARALASGRLIAAPAHRTPAATVTTSVVVSQDVVSPTPQAATKKTASFAQVDIERQ